MKTSLIAIGNSRGVRIPKPLIEHCGLRREVKMEVSGRKIVISSTRRPRQGWDRAFARMAQRGDDKLLDDYLPTRVDEEEWEWK